MISGDYKEAFAKIGTDIERTNEPFLQNSIVEVDNNKLKPGDKTLESLVAEDFLTRTKQVRDDTIVIVHANKDRKTINEHIREGLKQEGVIAKNGLNLDCLISKNLTDAEYRVLSSYKTGDIIDLAKKYYHVAEIDYDSKSLLLKDEKNNSKLFYPDKYAKKYNVYEKTKSELAVGDNIRLTKTDKERSLYANFKYEVIDLNEDKVTLSKTDAANSKEAGSTITLNPKKLSDAHWDYAYTVTGYGIQGGSKPYVIDFEPSYRKNLANQRSFYIAISRATVSYTHLTLPTKRIV